jgi:hypothetical protein
MYGLFRGDKMKYRELVEDEIAMVLLLETTSDIDGLFNHVKDASWALQAIEKRFKAQTT